MQLYIVVSSGGSSTRPSVGSTATGSLAHRVRPERMARPGKMRMATSTTIAKNIYTCKACINIPAVRLCAHTV